MCARAWATKDLLVAVFGRNTLGTHCYTGKCSNAFRGKAAKPRLDSEKVSDIIYVEIEETFTVKQEDLQEQTGPIVYVIGDSYIRRGEEQARQTVGTNLGLNAHIRWFGCGGLVWRNLVSFFHRCLEGRAVPDVLLIHCGGNDLGNIKSVILAAVMKQDLQDLHRQFPQMKIIFSAITQRCLWRSAESLRKVDRARRFVNHAMATIMVSVGGAIVHHPEITYKDPGHFLHDRVHLTPLGNDIFLKNLAQCLKNQIQ
nr:uncharacterized protein LOC108183877 [Danio rerio]|eukprot:XP_021331036.1 uncharacterized protein LOC108183877 [Danio rerio]